MLRITHDIIWVPVLIPIVSGTMWSPGARLRLAGEEPDYLTSPEFHAFLSATTAQSAKSQGTMILSDTGSVIASSSTYPAEGSTGPRHSEPRSLNISHRSGPT